MYFSWKSRKSPLQDLIESSQALSKLQLEVLLLEVSCPAVERVRGSLSGFYFPLISYAGLGMLCIFHAFSESPRQRSKYVRRRLFSLDFYLFQSSRHDLLSCHFCLQSFHELQLTQPSWLDMSWKCCFNIDTIHLACHSGELLGPLTGSAQKTRITGIQVRSRLPTALCHKQDKKMFKICTTCTTSKTRRYCKPII